MQRPARRCPRFKAPGASVKLKRMRQVSFLGHPPVRGIFGSACELGGPIKTLQKSATAHAERLRFARCFSMHATVFAARNAKDFWTLGFSCESPKVRKESRRSHRPRSDASKHPNCQRAEPRRTQALRILAGSGVNCSNYLWPRMPPRLVTSLLRINLIAAVRANR